MRMEDRPSRAFIGTAADPDVVPGMSLHVASNSNVKTDHTTFAVYRPAQQCCSAGASFII
jgi:hypothetical protein